MPRLNYKWCKECNGHVTEVGVLSHNRLCAVCSDKRRRSAALSMSAHSGPEFEKWRRSMAACVGASFSDDAALTP